MVDPAACQLRIVDAVEGIYVTHQWRNVVVMHWIGPARRQDTVAYERACKRRRQEYPNGLSSVHIISPKNKELPSVEARRELARIFNIYASGPSVVLIRGTGFWASAIRGMVTALRLLVPKALDMLITTEESEVPSWLAPRHIAATGVHVTEAELAQVLLQTDTFEAAS